MKQKSDVNDGFRIPAKQSNAMNNTSAVYLITIKLFLILRERFEALDEGNLVPDVVREEGSEIDEQLLFPKVTVLPSSLVSSLA